MLSSPSFHPRTLPIQRVTQSMSTGGLVNLDVRIPPEEMLDLASKRLPSATFRRADMTDLTQAFPEAASIAGALRSQRIRKPQGVC